MYNTLKYKVIISFVTIEVIFLTLIVGLNFTSLNRASKTLMDEKIQISSELLVELVKTPLIVFDIATIDNAVESFSRIKNVVAVQVTDQNNNVLSNYLQRNTISSDVFNSSHQHSMKFVESSNGEYHIYSLPVNIENEEIGHIHFAFNVTESVKTIENNKNLTYLLILLATIVGLIVSYAIGSKLSRSLYKLRDIAHNIANDKPVKIQFNTQDKDEVSQLFSAMKTMQDHITKRTQNLNNSLNNLEQLMTAIDKTAIVSKTDLNGVITYANSRFCEISGYSIDEILGKTHKIIRDPEIDNGFYKELWDTISSKKIFYATFRNINKNGNYFHVNATIVPLMDNEGNIVEYVGIRDEVTSLVDEKDNAIKAREAKEEFLSNMSHEIRTPMNAILGFVKILQKNIADETNISYLNIIESSSQALLHIINDILDFSKIESGKLLIDKQPFSPAKELELVIKLFSINAKEKSIDLTLNIANDIPFCLDGDLIRIKQILFNFLSNALKFTQQNRNITVSVCYNHKEGIFSAAVKDEGIGMSADAQKRVFNAFEQADDSTTRRFGGTGLGLTISAKLAKLMSGNITLESEENKGSTFTLTLPLDICLDGLQISSAAAEETLSKVKGCSGNILVAEDNKTNQMLIGILLDDYGLTYTLAEDGLEAVDAFKKSKFDIVLMDENMPNMTGSEAFEKIREYEVKNALAHTPVVALTANVLQHDIEKFINIGMDDFLAKPIDTQELERVLCKFLTNSYA